MRSASVSLLLLTFLLPACSGDSTSGAEGSGGTGSGGTGSGGLGSGGSSSLPTLTGWDACPSGFQPADAEALAQAHAGSYVFVPTRDSCSIDGITLTLDQPYAVTLAAAPARIVLSTGQREFPFQWDGLKDFACETSLTSALEIGWEGGFVRAGFIGSKPSSLLVNYCLGELRLP